MMLAAFLLGFGAGVAILAGLIAAAIRWGAPALVKAALGAR